MENDHSGLVLNGAHPPHGFHKCSSGSQLLLGSIWRPSQCPIHKEQVAHIYMHNSQVNVTPLLYSASEELLGEPVPAESTPSPLTLDCRNDEPCYLHIDVTGLRKYRPSLLELVSGSRTVEVYDRQRDEYLSTVRGALVKTPSDR